MGDEQDAAEVVDQEMVGADPVTSDEVGAFDDAPDAPLRLVEPEILVDSDLLELIDEDGDLAEPD